MNGSFYVIDDRGLRWPELRRCAQVDWANAHRRAVCLSSRESPGDRNLCGRILSCLPPGFNDRRAGNGPFVSFCPVAVPFAYLFVWAMGVQWVRSPRQLPGAAATPPELWANTRGMLTPCSPETPVRNAFQVSWSTPKVFPSPCLPARTESAIVVISSEAPKLRHEL